MKHFRLLFLTVVLSAVCATASAQRVTLDMQNAKLEKVLGQITQQTGLVFNYTRPTINPDKRVSVSVKQAELESVLRQLFDADGIVYEIKDGKVYLADRKGGVNPPPALSAARQRYAGRIVDAAGNPVVGASVVIRGSTTGVSSDIDGRFAIEARDHHARSQDDADPDAPRGHIRAGRGRGRRLRHPAPFAGDQRHQQGADERVEHAAGRQPDAAAQRPCGRCDDFDRFG